MSELLVDFITSLDGYASGEGWPGFWGLEGPEYLAWLGEQPEATLLMGANTYRLMSGFSAGEIPGGQDELRPEEEASVDHLTQASKVVFSSSLEERLAWANSTLVRDNAVDAVRAMKAQDSGLLSTIGSLSLSRSLLQAGLVDRFRVVMFPVITGATVENASTTATRTSRSRWLTTARSTVASRWSSTSPACSTIRRSRLPSDRVTDVVQHRHQLAGIGDATKWDRNAQSSKDDTGVTHTRRSGSPSAGHQSMCKATQDGRRGVVNTWLR